MQETPVCLNAADVRATEEPVHTRAGRYLLFGLGSEEFGLQVLRVREILGVQEITSVPQTERSVKGVINLRGRVIPVVDLRLKFGLDEAEYTTRTCVIVTEIGAGRATRWMGLVVDGVTEVVSVVEDEIEDAPDFGRPGSQAHLCGLAKIKGKVKILLDIDKVFGAQELSQLESVWS